MKKWIFGMVIILLVLPLFFVEAEALSIDEDVWENFVTALPDEVSGLLDDGALENAEEFGEAVTQMSSPEQVLGVIAECLEVEFGSALKTFCTICALLVVCAVFSNIGASFFNGALTSALRFCSSGVIFASVIYTQSEHFERIGEFFDSLGGLMRAIIPIGASLWAMGGNVVSASSGSATFYVMLGVCEHLFATSVMPICSIMSVFALCDSMSDELRMGRIAGVVRKVYNFFLCAVMTILVSSLAAQTALNAAADTTAARTAKLVSGSVIPILGGSVGETLRTVASGVGYLKSVFGVGGILMILSLLLPILLSVLLFRLAFLISGGFADMLGCSNEARLLDGLGEVCGTMLAVMTSSAVMFVLALCIFMQSAVAVA